MTTLDYILIILLVLAVLVAVYFYLTRRKAAKRAVDDSNEDLKRQILFSSNEVLRYKTLYESIKNAEISNQNLSHQHDERKNAAYRHILSEAESVMLERKQIEEEKIEVENRNRKLWDMSLKIQKEKERIDFLKRDIERKHISVTDSIHYARYIQLAVLPPVDVLGNWFKDYFIFWRPLEIVSGDFYWMKQSGDLVVFTVADCTGHGVPGAFMSLLGITFLNDICVNLDEKTMPSDILEALRANIITAMSRNIDGRNMDDGMDIALCIYNTKTKKVYFSGANNPMLLVRNGELSEYKAIRNPIGKYPVIKPFITYEVEVMPGDWIYMFSDGFIDQFGEKTKRKLMSTKFRNLIKSLSVEKSSGKAQENFLGEFLINWKGNFLQMDDILVGGYQI
ncbi:MAG: SpoIIE family protein phosphatase [Bacteroidales bacterium]|nr:SpoIIE family protein phosphatase [Bacteroidales bacterium]